MEELSFSDDGRLLTRADGSAPAASGAAPGARSSHIVDLFWAAVDASAQVKDLETLTGRLAMVRAHGLHDAKAQKPVLSVHGWHRCHAGRLASAASLRVLPPPFETLVMLKPSFFLVHAYR